MLALTSLSLGLPTAPTPPTFALDYYVGRQDALAINQGGYKIENGVCCSMKNSASCKIQGINLGGDTYEQGSKERSRTDSAQGSTVEWFGNVNKRMAIVPGAAVNSSHKFACAQYCPLQGKYFPSLIIGDGQKGPFDNPKDLGEASVTQPAAIGNTTKVCERWRWTETLLKLIPMSTTNFYVDMSVKPPAPFFESQIIKPFNKEIGEQNSSFIDYTPKDVEAFFDIDNASIATCKMSDSCDPDNPPSPPGAIIDEAKMVFQALSPHHHAINQFFPKPTMRELAEVEVKRGVAAPPNGPLPPQPNITFVADFTAHEELLSLINQGGTTVGGDPCCLSNAPAPQCQVQLQHQSGMRYLDVTNQRTRFEDAVGKQTVIDDYKTKQSMLINVTDGKETCQEYCPIDPDDKLEPFDPFDPFDPTKDMGATTIAGYNGTVEHYQQKDRILKIIVMSTTDFYANIANPKAAIPVYSQQELTPFGKTPPIGTTNQTWTAFKAGPPSATKFVIAGMATCPMSKQCGSDSKQAHRIALRQFHTASNYLELF